MKRCWVACVSMLVVGVLLVAYSYNRVKEEIRVFLSFHTNQIASLIEEHYPEEFDYAYSLGSISYFDAESTLPYFTSGVIYEWNEIKLSHSFQKATYQVEFSIVATNAGDEAEPILHCIAEVRLRNKAGWEISELILLSPHNTDFRTSLNSNPLPIPAQTQR